MGALRQWVLSVTCASMAAALLESVAPKGALRRVCRLSCGLLLTVAMLSPLLEIDLEGVCLPGEIGVTDRTEYEQELEGKNSEVLLAVIERRTEAYIMDKAKELGVECRAKVKYELSEDGTPYPAAVAVTGDIPEGEVARLSEAIEAELGVPRSGQSFTKEAG